MIIIQINEIQNLYKNDFNDHRERKRLVELLLDTRRCFSDSKHGQVHDEFQPLRRIVSGYNSYVTRPFLI